MNKSTPLNQLPNNMMMQNSFVNDQQRHIVTGAQQAIGNQNIPQNTQLQPEIGDDDAEIQEALNDVNAQLQQNFQKQQQSQTRQQIQPIHMMQEPAEYHNQQSFPNIPIENQEDIMFMQGARYPMQPPMMQQQMMQPPVNTPNKDTSFMSEFFTRFADDVKLAVLIAAVVALVYFIPFDSIIGKYFAIEKIPYHDVLLKALFAALIVVTLKNLIF